MQYVNFTSLLSQWYSLTGVPAWHNPFPVNKTFVIGYIVTSRLLSRWCVISVFPFFPFLHFALSHSGLLCCWMLWCAVSRCLAGLIKADTETGCITALMKSVSADCTQGWLAVQQHYLPPCRRGRETEGLAREWDTEVDRNLAESLCLRLYVHVCLSNYTLMNKALCHAGVPHFSGFKPEEQTATASLLRLTGTEQNTNVHRRQRDRRDTVMKGEEREKKEASVKERKKQGGKLNTGCEKKSISWKDSIGIQERTCVGVTEVTH